MEFVLDIDKWKSGSDYGPEPVGEGSTQLCNDAGYMCCLGQFAKQCGYTEEELQQFGDPEDLLEALNDEFNSIEGLDDDKCNVKPKEGYEDFVTINVTNTYDHYKNTPLAIALIEANDSKDLGIRERAARIREILEDAGHSLKVINEERMDEVVEANRSMEHG
jgi:hypothetical protein